MTEEEGKRKAASGLKPLLAAKLSSGTNTVLLSHSTNILATIGFAPEEREAIVFKPGNSGTYSNKNGTTRHGKQNDKGHAMREQIADATQATLDLHASLQ